MSLIFSSSKGIYWYEKYGCLEIIEVIFMLLFNRILSYAEKRLSMSREEAVN